MCGFVINTKKKNFFLFFETKCKNYILQQRVVERMRRRRQSRLFAPSTDTYFSGTTKLSAVVP